MRRLLLLALVATATLPALAAPSPASADCITTLPVNFRLPSSSFAAYTRDIPITVITTGPPIRHTLVRIYTYRGTLIARGNYSGTITDSQVVHMRIFHALQPRHYTLLIDGEPNANRSCGPKQFKALLKFYGCRQTALPVTFPQAPGGRASDYDDELDVPVDSRQDLKNVQVSLSTFGGDTFGTTTLRSIREGSSTLRVPLNRPLIASGYTLLLSGLIGSQPASCGPKTAKTTFTLK